MQIASFIAGESGSIREIEHALWEVRYTVLLQLRHWKLRSLDVWTVEESPAASASAEAARQFAALKHHGSTRFQT